jgi:ribosomal protein L29
MAKTKEKKQERIKLSDLSVGELQAKSKTLRSDLVRKQLDKGVGRLRNTRDLFNIRKEIARVKTLINIKLKLNSVKS